MSENQILDMFTELYDHRRPCETADETSALPGRLNGSEEGEACGEAREYGVSNTFWHR